jgi:hypothetical protein
MNIKMCDVKDAIPDRNGKKKNKTYCKYADAIQKHVPWIKEQITNNGIIRVKAVDIAKEMGREFEKKDPTSIYWALKFSLFQVGIVVDTATHKSGDKLLIMRMTNDKDCLPASLTKFLDSDKIIDTIK